jgi:hypothetical protein
MILVDHIQNSGVSIRTGYSAESGPWQSGHWRHQDRALSNGESTVEVTPECVYAPDTSL